MQPELYHPSKKDTEAISNLYAEAFADSPSHTWALPDKELFKQKAPRCFRCQTVLALRVAHMISTSEKLEAILQYFPPGIGLTQWDELRSGILGIYLTSWGRPFLKRWLYLGKMDDKIKARNISGMHYYLWSVAVQPRFQRQGYGTRLMNGFLSEVDTHHLPCYVETFKEKNVPYYERFGFKLVEECPIPDTPLVSHAVIRSTK